MASSKEKDRERVINGLNVYKFLCKKKKKFYITIFKVIFCCRETDLNRGDGGQTFLFI